MERILDARESPGCPSSLTFFSYKGSVLGRCSRGGGGRICKMGGERGAGISEAGLEGPLRPSSRWSSSAAQRTLSQFPPALTRSLLAASLGLRFFSEETPCTLEVAAASAAGFGGVTGPSLFLAWKWWTKPANHGTQGRRLLLPFVAGGCLESNVAGLAWTVHREEAHKLTVVYTHTHTHAPVLAHRGKRAAH